MNSDNRLALPGPDFFDLVDRIAPPSPDAIGVVAASSARVYRSTYDAWHDWCMAAQVDPLDITFATAGAFLQSRPGTKSSQQRELSALRTLAQTLSIVDYANPARAAAYESLKMLKVRSANRDNERERRALSPADADRMLRIWQHDDTPRGKRNRTIVAVALLSGLRRAELAALTWNDIDLDSGVIYVRHGKGDKAREAALYGTEAHEALEMWYMAQPADYRYIFVPVRRGGTFAGDVPLTTTSIWRVVDETAELAGVGHVKPHDLRRTLATELLDTGTPVHHVQQQLGHSDSATTINSYTGKTDATQRRKSGRLRYG